MFFISWQPDAVLGTKVVLIIEGEEYKIDADFFNSLSKFEKPKEIFFVSQFSETATNKVNRIQTLKSMTSPKKSIQIY
jgi:O-succinylbenzoic acid--CoA ligase